MSDFEHYIANLLQENFDSTKDEIEVMRLNLRRRLKMRLLKLWSFSIYIARLLLRYLRTGTQQLITSLYEIPEAARRSNVWLFSPNTLENRPAVYLWNLTQAKQLAHCLDTHVPQMLVIQSLTPALCRRLARLRSLGCQILWQPKANIGHDPALLAYVQQFEQQASES